MDNYQENEEVFDTYDRIIDESELNKDPDDINQEDPGMQSEHFGMAFALAEELIEEASIDCNLDENTDAENFEKAMALNGNFQEKGLRPFEQIINDICKGRRSLFDTNY